MYPNTYYELLCKWNGTDIARAMGYNRHIHKFTRPKEQYRQLNKLMRELKKQIKEGRRHEKRFY